MGLHVNNHGDEIEVNCLVDEMARNSDVQKVGVLAFVTTSYQWEALHEATLVDLGKDSSTYDCFHCDVNLEDEEGKRNEHYLQVVEKPLAAILVDNNLGYWDIQSWLKFEMN